MVPDEQDAAAQQDQKIPVKIKSEYVHTNTHTTLTQVHFFFFNKTKAGLYLFTRSSRKAYNKKVLLFLCSSVRY